MIFCEFLIEKKRYIVIEMEKEHRRIILDNISELIKLTKYDILMKKCLDRKIMFPVMKSEIEVNSMGLTIYWCRVTKQYFPVLEATNWTRNET